MKTFLVTHSDLDGIGAAVIAKKAIPNLWSISYQDYPTIDGYINILLQRKDLQKNDFLLIADISPSLETCKLLDERANEITIKMFDHHDSKAWIRNYPWATFNDSTCGTLQVYEEFVQCDPQLQNYKEFADSVEAWDNWRLTSAFRARGEALHNLHKLIGTQDFVDAFVASPNADKEEPYKSLMKFVEQKKNRIVGAAVASALERPLIRIDSLGRSFIIVFATDYVSEIAHAILAHPDYSDLKYVVVYNQIFETCSLRSSVGGADVGDLAKRLNGGGRKDTAGFPYYTKKITEENLFKFINSIEF
jgi:oligoribonuclease NrnB/cAMP/cGMP phosphodiesterase (DHH superfamily)